ncbi:predicted protein [Ostreococcus lucimarinus CCE9901]|uniref:Uncharacterized protein n=1 Tax=Ostreococcus lucimarinus (strain CCE9901) TaxID=436017 RepID=A4RWP5_OSTLU|nr:predicted protein [Ostreococcus lucimarinus CCE9901]ABO95908.1 predicted protein [Ostreococcus lucimarinus CCE9901]|eukprot:XP_001417615.1 predicted protein [Ostreococcus lucimarinus CCE9901]
MTATGRVFSAPIEPASGSARALLESFFEQQRARSSSYERWNGAYASMLAGTTSEDAFVLETKRTTDDMRGYSEKILGIEEGLKRLDRTSAAMLVRVIQQNERVRLEMTAALQVLRRAAAREAWSWQRGGERAAAETTMNLKPSWARTEDCDPAACAIGCACAKDGPEPTEEEYSNAVGEATQTLERAFGEINDAIEELRYELEDEVDGGAN